MESHREVSVSPLALSLLYALSTLVSRTPHCSVLLAVSSLPPCLASRILQGRELELKDHTQSVEGISWHPNHADTLASISTDKTLRIWDIRGEHGFADHPKQLPAVLPNAFQSLISDRAA